MLLGTPRRSQLRDDCLYMRKIIIILPVGGFIVSIVIEESSSTYFFAAAAAARASAGADRAFVSSKIRAMGRASERRDAR